MACAQVRKEHAATQEPAEGRPTCPRPRAAAIAGVAGGPGHILYGVALSMARFNVAGNVLGACLALRHGSGLVRRLYVVIVSVLILRFAWDLGS